MKLKVVAANKTVVTLGQAEVLFSYETPVAAFIPGLGYICTDKKYSSATSRHISGYAPNAHKMPDETFQLHLNRILGDA